ncbi:replication protein, partial [Faecalibacterium prausnitzii]|nr:replication protein [Faecalibacterium prausnitzii]
EAERKRAARLENKALLPPRTKGGHLSDIRPPEIEIELEKEIEKEREGETGHPAPAAYGRYNNVTLTDTELSGLKTELPDKWEYYIDRLSCHIASTGKQYHSHAATIYKWAQEDAAKGKAAPKQGIPDYSCKEGESL